MEDTAAPAPSALAPKLQVVEHRPAAARRDELVALYREMRDCHDCPLAHSRTKLVFGAGNADADLMFVGEAPGFHEDQQGLPFVGRAGKLLDELLAEIGLERGQVWITNVLKCRPPGNRDPLPEEVDACKPYLYRQIELVQPLVICTLGNFATRCLTRSAQGISKCHGRPQVHLLGGRWLRVVPLYHPAAALRTPACLSALQHDLATVPGLLEEPSPEPLGGLGVAPAGNGEPRAEAESQLGLFG
jgi:uracil-DNA glycosylase family 4